MKVYLSFIFTLFIALQLTAQDLPDEWKISADGRILTAGGDIDEGFYGQTELHDIELAFLQENWWEQMEENYQSATDILATCWINGIQYDSVGVRFKGATSYFRNDTEKKSFNITLDYMIDGQDIEGYNTFNLNCGWEDNSSMKEVLFNNVSQQYYMGLKSNFVNLTINGVNWGPYQNVQQFDSDYIKEWFLSNDGTIWRAQRTDFVPGQGGMGGPNFGAGESTLNYNGPDSTDYNTDYTLKRTEQEDPWAGMITACDILNNEPLATLEEELYKVLDIDKACWFLANEIIFADDDSYVNKGGSDYYVYYEAETGRIVPMEYDGNSVLGENRLDWDLFLKSNDTDFPLMNRMLAVPSIRQRYLAHVRVILENYFTSSYTDPKVDDYLELIDQDIQADPKKFYTYEEFQAAIVSLKQAIVTRRNSLLSDSELSNVAPLIVEEVSYAVEGMQWQAPDALNLVDVVAKVTGAPGATSVWLYYGEGLTGVFTKTEMYDDGLHNDGAALDGQYGAAIPPSDVGTYVRYYIEAIAGDAARTATYEPKGAEHDVYLYQVGFESALDSSVVINELMAENDTAVEDDFGEFDDWVELYNLSSSEVNLSGWTLTDDINEVDKYTFPEGTIVTPESYLVIWADDDEDQGEFHSNFKLSANGETLYLLNSMEELVDEIKFPEAITDLSYARTPNGTGSFVYKAHTLGENNNLTSGLSDIIQEQGFRMYPNPAGNHITIASTSENPTLARRQILNVNGQVLYSDKGSSEKTHTIVLANLSPGIYFMRVETGSQIIIHKFVKI